MGRVADDAAISVLIERLRSGSGDCYRARLSRRCGSLREPGQTGEVIGEIGERDLGGCPRRADRPNHQMQAALFAGEDVLDLGLHPGAGGVAALDIS